VLVVHTTMDSDSGLGYVERALQQEALNRTAVQQNAPQIAAETEQPELSSISNEGTDFNAPGGDASSLVCSEPTQTIVSNASTGTTAFSYDTGVFSQNRREHTRDIRQAFENRERPHRPNPARPPARAVDEPQNVDNLHAQAVCRPHLNPNPSVYICMLGFWICDVRMPCMESYL
jgi:hypothetical protein